MLLRSLRSDEPHRLEQLCIRIDKHRVSGCVLCRRFGGCANPPALTWHLVSLVTVRGADRGSNVYSSSAGTGVQDLSGLNRSMFLNSSRVLGPKSFS